MTAEFRSNQVKIKNILNEMQSKLEVRTIRVNEERLREINDSLRRKNIHIIGVPETVERDRGPESIFEQVIADNFPNLGRETGIQIQEIEMSSPPQKKSIKTFQNLNI